MNYSIRLLKLVIFLCLGIVSIAAWAVDADYNDELIEKAWACSPRSSGRSMRPTAEPKFLIDFGVASLQLCGDHGDLMRKALLNKYFTFRWVPVRYEYGPQVIGPTEWGAYDEFIRKSKRQGDRGVELTGVDSYRFDQEKKRREEEAREREIRQAMINRELREKQELEQQELQKAKQEAEKQYQQRLRSGAAPVKNFQDAALLHTPTADLMSLMVSPLLKPDKGIYSGRVMLDAEENDDLLRAKLNLSLLGGGVYYAHLRLTKKTVDFSSSMRIGATVNVMGRYVKNRKYTTIAGEEKTMPVLEVMYIGG